MDDTPRARAARLVAKLTGTPFFPLLAYGKLVEALIATAPLIPWTVASVVATVIYVFGEDLLEYIQQGVEEAKEEYE